VVASPSHLVIDPALIREDLPARCVIADDIITTIVWIAVRRSRQSPLCWTITSE
jgi:hypothetical protein